MATEVKHPTRAMSVKDETGKRKSQSYKITEKDGEFLLKSGSHTIGKPHKTRFEADKALFLEDGGEAEMWPGFAG